MKLVIKGKRAKPPGGKFSRSDFTFGSPALRTPHPLQNSLLTNYTTDYYKILNAR